MSIIKFEKIARLQLLKTLSSNSYKQIRFYVNLHTTNQSSSEKFLKLPLNNSTLNNQNIKLPLSCRKFSTSNISNNKDIKYVVKNNEEKIKEKERVKANQNVTWSYVYWYASVALSLIIFELIKKQFKSKDDDNSITYDDFVETYLKCGQVETLYVSAQEEVAVVKLNQDEDEVPPKVFPIVGGFVDGSDLIRKLSLESPHGESLNIEHNEEYCKEAKSDIVHRKYWKNAEYLVYAMNGFTFLCVFAWNVKRSGWDSIFFIQMFNMFKR